MSRETLGIEFGEQVVLPGQSKLGRKPLKRSHDDGKCGGHRLGHHVRHTLAARRKYEEISGLHICLRFFHNAGEMDPVAGAGSLEESGYVFVKIRVFGLC